MSKALYRFAYNVVPGVAAEQLVTRIRMLLRGVGIQPEIDVRDAGGFQRVRVMVPADMETAAGFRLMSVNHYLASEGKAS